MQQRETLVADLKPPLRRLFRAIEQRGPLGAPDLRVDLPLNGTDGVWKGRTDGLTFELRALRAKGLIRQISRRSSRARIYEVTPEGEIDNEAEKFKRNQPPKRQRDMTGATARIADLRRQEKEAGPATSRAHAIEARRRTVELYMALRRLWPILHWSEKAMPEDELEYVYDYLVAIEDWAHREIAVADARRGNRQLREKVAALRAKAHSTEFPGEAEVFRAKALELEAKVDGAG
jgi:hypothetical protein